MCGRFALTLPHDAVAGFFDAAHVKTEFTEPRYNVCPTQEIPVAVEFGGERYLTPMRWGFIPHWYKSPTDGPLLINARSETITEKPAFRDAVQKRRCLVPVSGFFEWHRTAGKGKEPWYFTQEGADLFALGGIWQAWTSPETGQRQVTCAVVTTAAGDRMSEIHHREPVVIDPTDFSDWLAPEAGMFTGKLSHQPDGFYHRHRVSRAVNSARTGDASLIEPIEE